MKLFLVHCGYYDLEVGEGLFESHYNFFVAATDVAGAKLTVKTLPLYQQKKMHVDGLQEISAVGGYDLLLAKDSKLAGETVIINHKHRGLAPKKQPANDRYYLVVDVMESLDKTPYLGGTADEILSFAAQCRRVYDFLDEDSISYDFYKLEEIPPVPENEWRDGHFVWETPSKGSKPTYLDYTRPAHNPYIYDATKWFKLIPVREEELKNEY